MKALFYDLEIKKCIPPKAKRGLPRPALNPDLEYCYGWTDHRGMGISCLCTYASWEDDARVFDEGNLGEFHEYAGEADLLVSYNGLWFDNKVIDARPHGKPMPKRKCFDLRVALLDAAPDLRFERGYKLGEICERTFGLSKSGEGALAPVLWQGGRYAEVIDYCLKDTKLVQRLYQHCLEGRPLMGLNGREIILAMPQDSSGSLSIGC